MNPPDFTGLTIDQKIGQLFFIGLPGPEFDDTAARLLAEIQPGGICLFARNIRERMQTRELLDALRDRSAAPPFLSLDQEGGLVDRLRRVVTPMPAADKIRTVKHARDFGTIIGETIAGLGFNMNFAPVVDVVDEARAKFNNGLRSRAFPVSAADLIALAAAFLEGLESSGVIGCLKHFPGLGGAQVDSHDELPSVSITEGELREVDLHPYIGLANSRFSPAVMVAHAAYPNFGLQESAPDGKLLPASLSYNFVTKLLREEIKFDGVAITDDLEMGAVLRNFGIGEAAVRAVNAGEDMLAICASPEAIFEAHNTVRAAVESGAISRERLDQSVNRIGNLKKRMITPIEFDESKLSALSDEIAAFASRLS